MHLHKGDIASVMARRLEFDGAVSFRDLGGYDVGDGSRTRWRCLFRPDSLSDLTAADHDRLASLRLHTLIDFRLSTERARRPNALPPGADVTTAEIGFLPEGTLEMLREVLEGTLDAAGVEREMLRHYRRFALAHHREYAGMFDAIERAEGAPVLIHCTSGKDRTGYGAALVLLALGASLETVIEDYALTNYYRRDVNFLFSAHTPPMVVGLLLSVQPKYIEVAVAEIVAHHGSVDAYLDRALGLTDARRARLRAWFTETAVHSAGN